MGRVNEWVEAAGSSVDVAVEAALAELGLESPDQVEVEVLQQPVKGVLGTSWRSQDALVKVTAKPPEKKRRRRGGRRRSSGSASSKTRGDADQRSGASAGKEPSKAANGGGRQGSSSTKGRGPSRSRSTERSGGKSSGSQGKPRQQSGEKPAPKPRTSKPKPRTPEESPALTDSTNAEVPDATIEDQAAIAAEFVKGLLEAYGLEGEVTTSVDEDVLKIDVSGDQTEALVGRRGAIMNSVLDVTRTVVQRKTFGAPRMRIDINGYGERRREALRIYTKRQAERVLEEGGEIMLEPMNAADRKVVHDAVADIDGVESLSEGEDPDRAVVITATG